MTEQDLALLKSLAIRPTQHIAPNIEHLVIALSNAGYVTCGPDGWTATAEGCDLIERTRTPLEQRRSASSAA
jgi:hypothetical protein